ncbi:MAG TPA: hypothetical protein VG408_04160, partial [Actinomycetota bacterium]|nr:hypothetical protein [Actinomycetota bacterium]
MGALGLARAGSSRRWIVGLFCVATSLSALNAERSAGPSPLAGIARSVPRCATAGYVIESHGGLGTLVAIQELRCRYADAQGIEGVAITDDLTTDAGSRIVATGWLLPLADDPFGRARRKTGAAVELDVVSYETRPPTQLVHRTSAFLRSSLRDATSQLDGRRSGLLRGLAIGDTDLIDGATNDRFRRSGLSHLVAVSG